MSNGQSIYDNGMYDDLRRLADELETWFDVDKVKPYGVYVWNRPSEEDLKHPNCPYDEFGENVFDIFADHLQFYHSSWPWRLPNEAMPVIKKIQEKLVEIDEYCKGTINDFVSSRKGDD